MSPSTRPQRAHSRRLAPSVWPFLPTTNQLSLAVLRDGGMYVADSGNHRVVFYASLRTAATQVWGQPGFTTNAPGSNSTALGNPSDIAFSSTGVMYVVEFLNHRVGEEAVVFGVALIVLSVGFPRGSFTVRGCLVTLVCLA